MTFAPKTANKNGYFFQFLTEMFSSQSHWNTNFPRSLPKTPFYHPEYSGIPWIQEELPELKFRDSVNNH